MGHDPQCWSRRCSRSASSNRSLGRLDAAEQALTRALAIAARRTGRCGDRARLPTGARRPVPGAGPVRRGRRPARRAAIRQAEAVLGPDAVVVAEACDALAVTAKYSGDFDEAAALYARRWTSRVGAVRRGPPRGCRHLSQPRWTGPRARPLRGGGGSCRRAVAIVRRRSGPGTSTSPRTRLRWPQSSMRSAAVTRPRSCSAGRSGSSSGCTVRGTTRWR